MGHKPWLVRGAVSVLLGMLAACQSGNEAVLVTDSGRAATVLAAGDIADCDSAGDEATAELLEPASTILALGDLAYENGTAKEFQECYQPSWGAYPAITRPVPGNHEYHQPSALPYFEHFGGTAGSPGQGWYSFDLGPWHLVALNSNCDDIGGCEAGSAQERWLAQDLATHPSRCTLAYWHHPRFSSGATHGETQRVRRMWDVLFQAGAEIVLTGHEHNYERFSPLDPSGQPDAARGIRQFVVGTGGGELYPFGPPVTGSEFRYNESFGVLRLVLRSDGYEWQFISVAGNKVVDAGSDRCH